MAITAGLVEAAASLSMPQLALIAALGLVSALVLSIVLKPAARLPQGVPVLRLSSKPGKAGAAEDIAAFEFSSDTVIKAGYERYSSKGQNWLLRTKEGMTLIVAPEFVNEIKSAPDAQLDPMPINNNALQVQHTLHPALLSSWHEFDIVRVQLTQSLGATLPELVSECHRAFVAEVGAPREWTKLPIWHGAQRIVTRTANRVFFGEQLAADKTFLDLSTNYTSMVFGGAVLIRQWPDFLRPLVLRLKTDMVKQKLIANQLLAPLLDRRIKAAKRELARGDDPEANTLVQWLLDVTPAAELADRPLLVQRLMHIVVSAVHTSSISFLDVIYELAQHPEIHAALQDEIVAVFAQSRGWSRQALSQLTRMDSLLRESARHHPFLNGSVERHVVRDFTLSNGTVVPRGMKLSVPQQYMNMDARIYGADAAAFDAFRFSKLREEPGAALKHSFVQTSNTFLHFGHGKHACPGRFFASNELKVLLVYFIARYEVRWPQGQAAPGAGWYGGYRVPDTDKEVEIRLRETPLVEDDVLLL